MKSAAEIWKEWCDEHANRGPGAPSDLNRDIIDLAPVAASIWRIDMRARRDGAPDSVLLACERALDDLEAAGFKIETYVGDAYSENLRVHVVEHEGGEKEKQIVECIHPAVFLNNKLLSKAHVITRGTG